MVIRRIFYALLTVLAWVAFILTESAVALFVGITLLVLPACMLVLLLLVRNRIRFECTVQSACMRGSTLKVQMKLGAKPRFFVSCAEVFVSVQNTTFSNTEKKIFVFRDLSFSPVVYEYAAVNSGRICVNISQIRLWDIFGIYSVKIKQDSNCEVIVSPVLYENVHLLSDSFSRTYASGDSSDINRKGNDHAEILGVREYVPGDNLNAVHWKLTSKFDELMSKVFGSTTDHSLMLLVDLSRCRLQRVATDDDLNCVLDVAISLSNAFAVHGIVHSVGWLDNGVLRRDPVFDNESFLTMTNDLMSIKAEQNANAAFYISEENVEQRFSQYVFLCYDARPEEFHSASGYVYAVSIGPTTEEYQEEGCKIVQISPENVEVALSQGIL